MKNDISPMSTGNEELKKLLLNKEFTNIPKMGDIIKGIILSLAKNEMRIDIPGFKTGVIRGLEMISTRALYPDLAIDKEVEATVVELENERGEVELSMRFTGERRAWEEIMKLKQSGQIVAVRILDANRGGLMVSSGSNLPGFLPVSQLAPEHYPRVPGGDKNKILEQLKLFVGKTLKAKVLDANEKEKKLIFSEKGVWEEEQRGLLSKYKVDDLIEGKVTAIADFGAFIAFDSIEGLAHISEIAWQRLDHPSDVLKVGDTIRAKIINIDGSKIFLSMRALVDDPWKKVSERYQIGQKVQGKVLKVNPFGLFVELDPEIHGLAHVSELDVAPGEKLESKVKSGDVLEFHITSIEPTAHRLGLSQKAPEEQKEKTELAATATPETKEEKPAE
ncbi:MAG: S1 RNA-binding domain-containing protein [Patescibacteria group bacterium]